MDYLLSKTFLVELIITVLSIAIFPITSILIFSAIVIAIIYNKFCKSTSKLTTPNFMKAALYDYKEQYKISTIAVPKFSKDELLILVKAAAINPVDYKIRTIDIPFYRWTEQPTVGRDFSGIVVDIGSNVTNFKIGDEVYGNAKGGSIQQYTVANKNQIGLKPSNMTFCEASSIGLAAATSLQALKHWGELNNKKVLIIGASGGCGSFGVQIAKFFNAVVYGVCSSKNVEFVKSLGTDIIIDYSNPNYLESIKNENFDLIYDTVTSPEDDDQNLKYGHLLKNDGKYVAINGKGMDFPKSIIRKLTGCNFEKPNFHLTMLDWNNEDLEILRLMAEQGKLKTKIKKFNFEEKDVIDAFDQLKSRRTIGKIVFEI